MVAHESSGTAATSDRSRAPFAQALVGDIASIRVRVPADFDLEPNELFDPEYMRALFERGMEWSEETRCYERPMGARLLAEDQAYDMYREIAQRTTGVAMEIDTDVRTVLGIRGAYPGTFQWHGNTPDLFNDTLVLLWVDGDGDKHVREFAVNTDLGAYYFGFESSSSLRPNRRYHYVNGWHGSTPYNALHVDEIYYRVRNDTNANGHWDDDRNGWPRPVCGGRA